MDYTKSYEYAIVGFGSPIVDSILNYEDDPQLAQEIKQKLTYHMEANFPVDFYQSVLSSEKVENLLGGSAMNTIRIANFLLKQISKEKVAFFGSVGDDLNGEYISKKLSEEEIIFNKQILQNERTSTCIVVTNEFERTFYSDLASSNKISSSHFEDYSMIFNITKIFYADSYLIGSRFDVFKYIFFNYYEEDIILSLNLACSNIVRDYFENIKTLLPYVDLLFLNKEELEMLKKGFLMDVENREFIKFLQSYESKSKIKKRIVVNTQGIDDTLIGTDSNVLSIPVYKIKRESIIDTNGAGDSFSGAFLAGFLLNYNLEESVRLGNYIAAKIIMRKGFQIPKEVNLGELDFKKIEM